mmetsp:Transcript_9348/g.21083  ORF Transcript_9348/g.21083 Transcript_9348/m.21083 type:complete len:691 (+) Transcript_9348:93-2165(+)|eukprot:CAMPEP_0172314462 /NCGR_PEP_ID=MMETSP1058-20130122/22602_1 /TAXON_ID=83371 /ORGANISM="Detonula confervacea, Strain CCMP 353" /LENGTH=690 /DNA_ID=CAMNT_0013028341 /DNA_START=26 /DNA_END=2098 /DNA_ORIENTATION=+
MMNSDHLPEPDPLHESRLHHRETATNSDGQQFQSNGRGSSSPSPTTPPTPSTRKRRQKNFWDRTSGHLRLNVNDNYAKYGKKRVNKTTQLQSSIFWGAICIATFVLGFAWKYFTHEPSSSNIPKPQLRHSASQKWMPRENLKNPYAKLSDGHKKSPLRLLIPRFDTRRYVSSWEKNMKNAAQEVGKKQPKSIALEGWNSPIAFRSFPYVKQTHGPIKNLDSDYGGLTFHSVRNEEFFGRVIPEDGRDDIVPGGFDPDSIHPDQSLKRRNKQRRDSYPNFRSDGTKVLSKDASFQELTNYYDDDNVEVLRKANDVKTREPRVCHKPEFSHLYFPNCNIFHEHALGRVFDDPEKIVHPRPENEVYRKYLAHGYYRDVWIMEDPPWIWPSRYRKEKDQTSSQKFGVLDEARTSEMVPKAYRSTALKTLQMKHPFEDQHFEEVQLEAIVMERMTKSPRIMNMYGHCSFSTMVEVVPIEFEERVVIDEGYETNDVIEKRNKKGVLPFNNFTPTEKLGFALEMAESLADLHGFEDGVIVHDDVQLCQWLHTPDGRLKLGDFNRATFMQWDTVKGEYCKFNNGPAFANYRAPEEYNSKAMNLNEQIDTFSFGNNIYAMITGLWNFYDTDDDGVVHKKLIGGKLPYVDPRYNERSFGEKKLIELMEKCWVYDPDERISIFEAVNFLRKAIKENEAQSE